VDLADISLDLGTPGGGNGSGGAPDARWQEVATKLDLAKAYEEMGDKDGARELLKECEISRVLEHRGHVAAVHSAFFHHFLQQLAGPVLVAHLFVRLGEIEFGRGLPAIARPERRLSRTAPAAYRDPD